MTISKDEVRLVSKLARLSLPEEELVAYSNELSKILDCVDKLREINTENVEPQSMGSAEEKPHMRQDEIICDQEINNFRQIFTDNAPDTEENFFKVPKNN